MLLGLLITVRVTIKNTIISSKNQKAFPLESIYIRLKSKSNLIQSLNTSTIENQQQIYGNVTSIL